MANLENYIFEGHTSGVHTEAMGLVSSGHLVKRIYDGASPFAFVREFIQNSIDAGADRIEIGPDFVGVKTTADLGGEPVYKLSFSDNGEGLERSKMKSLLNNLSSSGRKMDADGNFGIGAKVAALPWNPHGIAFMSWTDNEQDGGMVRLFRRPDGNYALFRFNDGDDENDAFEDLVDPPPAYRESWQKPWGTTVVLMGKDAAEDTLFGPPSEEAGLYALMHVVNDRYFTFPEDTKVSVCVFENATKSKWPTTKAEAKKFYRQANGARWFLDKHSKESGTVKGDGVKIHWWWHPGLDSSGFDSYASPPGYVGAVYDGELYDTVRRIPVKKKRVHSYGLVSMYSKFGLFFEEVYNNVTIIVEPDKYSDKTPDGVFPDLSRGRLRLSGGNDLPWDQWGQIFASKLPPVIAAAVEKAADGTSLEVDFAARLKPFLDRMDIYSGLESIPRAPAGNNVPKRKKPTKTSKPVERTEGELKAGYNLPKPLWDKRPTAAEKLLFQGKAVHYSEGSRMVLFNTEFPLWDQVIKHWISKYSNAPGIAKKVREAVEVVYSDAILTRIVHVRKFKGKQDWSAGSITTALSNEALTMVVLGIMDADTRINSYLKGTVKMKRGQELIGE